MRGKGVGGEFGLRGWSGGSGIRAYALSGRDAFGTFASGHEPGIIHDALRNVPVPVFGF